jgi:hypothetical protein
MQGFGALDTEQEFFEKFFKELVPVFSNRPYKFATKFYL